MPFHDVAVSLTTYPDSTSPGELSRILRLCRALGDSACGLAVELSFPVKGNRLANMLIGLDDVATAEERRSRTQAQAVLAEFHRQAADLGLKTSEQILHAELYNASEQIASAVRTRDLCVVPYPEDASAQRGVAEGIVFGSGRPLVVFSTNQQPATPERIDRIVVAWDGGPPAARAVAEALPLLRAAEDVQVVTVLNEKPLARPGAASAIVAHLERHGVLARPVEIDAAGAPIGAALRSWLAKEVPHLLVMGAFGHSRAREFILGGATHDILGEPPLPVFLSH